MTKVVALSGGVIVEKGNTSKILKPFLDGMREDNPKTKVGLRDA